MRWRSHLRRLGKHVAWISLSTLVLAGLRAIAPAELLVRASAVIGSFLQTFGAMYGLIVAFAMYVVWQEHNETQSSIEREAVALAELHALLCRFTTWPARAEVAALLREYARVVPERNGEKPCAERADDRALLEQAHHAFLTHDPADRHEERLDELALELFRALAEAREHRLTVSRLRLPDGLRWFVFLGGAGCIGATALLWVEPFALHALLNAGMTWVVVAVASIVLDLDDPYRGDFVVEWGRFRQAREQMELAASGRGEAPTAR